MNPDPELCSLLRESANRLCGAERRRFMAETIERLGLSQRQAEACFGWSRHTIRKAQREKSSGIVCVDATSQRGRKPCEQHLPGLIEDIRALVEEQCQTDPTFQTTRLYCRVSGTQVRRWLIDRKGYTDEQLPTVQTIRTKLNAMGFRLKKVAKCRPQKNSKKPMPSLSD